MTTNVSIIEEKLQEISNLAEEIKKKSFPLCENDNQELSELALICNNKAYQIRGLVEKINGLLR